MPQKSNRSLERGLDILFAFRHECPLLTMDEIASRTGIPRSTCYRLVNTLKKKKLIDFDPTLGRYRLGMGLLTLHSVILDSLDIGANSRPFIQKLSQLTGETVQLTVHNSNMAVCIDKVESPEALLVRPDRGNVIGLHSGASGKCILAFLPESEQDRIIQETGLPKIGPNTITDPEELKKSLAEIRRQGYAISEQELYAGVKALAAPIFDLEDNVVASISVAGPRERLTQEKVDSLIEHVLKTARSISRRLGGHFRAKVEKSQEE